LRSFQQRLPDFDRRGIRVVAISVDSVEINKRHSQKLGYTFPLLSDVTAEVIRRYDLLHPGGGPHKEDISRPGEFLVDAAGKVRWLNLTENIGVRARPDAVLRAFDTSIAATDRGGRLD
jgi:peroxiredoxin